MSDSLRSLENTDSQSSHFNYFIFRALNYFDLYAFSVLHKYLRCLSTDEKYLLDKFFCIMLFFSLTKDINQNNFNKLIFNKLFLLISSIM